TPGGSRTRARLRRVLLPATTIGGLDGRLREEHGARRRGNRQEEVRLARTETGRGLHRSVGAAFTRQLTRGYLMTHVIVGMSGLVLATVLCNEALAQTNWPQWGQNSQHQGFVPSIGQDATSVLADLIYDPFTAAEERDTGGDLLVHYQVPL